jgi:peptide-methionine (S)-S-oxide reductase
VQLRFEPGKISYPELLVWFFKLHDPTTLNQQGADHGTQYRSAIFYHSEEQRRAAEKALQTLADAKAYASPVVTEVTEASTFYLAEPYHQDYYRQNKSAGYCQMVIAPKLEKLLLDR